MATAADPLRWTKQWRKATNVIRTCHRLARLTLSRAILRRTGSYVQIKIHDETDGDCDTGAAADADAAPAEFSVAADNEGFRRLVKDKRQDCFRRLGGAAGIASALASDAEAGIRGDDRDVRRRREAFGGNTYPRRKPKGFWTHVWDALSDVFLLVLLVCAAVSLGFGIKEHGLRDGWYDGVSIFLAVFLVAAVVAVSNHGQARRFDTLATESDNIAVNVVRGGRRQEVSIFDVVVGDVVVLNISDVVPADGVFLQGHPLQVDESSMTGEPHPVDVDAEKSPFLASGVKVIDGYGHMLVTAVGTDTAWGEMMGSITREKTEPMPLQERLTSSIGKVGIAVAVLVVDVLVFAFSMKRMVKEHALVRTLSACETMGSVTAICTDKTGTLTLNQMKVTEFWVGTDHRPKEVTGAVVSLLRQGAGLNTTGSVYKPDNASLPEISGSPTEKTLLTWAVADLGMDADALKRSCKVLHVEAFNSDKKRSGVMIRDNATGAVTAHWKGSAEMVLANCSAYVGSDGAARELDAGKRRKLEEIISEMAAASLRCIAFAYKHVDSEHSKIDDEGLTLLGFVGLKDPCQPEVRTAIVACAKAGVAVKMVTGDNLLTARAIAMECGIISNSDHDAIVIEGQEFRAMSPQEQWDIVDRSRVTARSLPMDKLVPVQRLKQRGHVVAVAGDGTNDAPALKEADVGLSKGIQGTEVAKESSDIVIMNDNFDTVVTATRWGRCVFNNIQKFIQFQLTVNVAALIINFVSAVTSGKMPLSTVQLLWVNLIMDTMGALALATDTPTKALAEGTSPNPPTGKRGPIRQAGRHRRDLAVASQTIKASVAGRRSLALVLLVVAVSVTGAAAVSNKSLNITNHCSYTVWPGILSGAGSTEVLDSTGFELAPGESRSVSVPSGWAGLLWARTLCSTDDTTGKFTCVTGDCGSGREDCAGGGPAPPVTLGGFTLDVSGGMDLYDVSLVDGFNLPMVVAPHAQGADPGGNCTSTGCVVDLNGACPAELRVTSGTSAVACKSACQAFGSAEYCCTGEYGNPNTCKPSAYSELFKKACPLAVSYAFDDGADSIFTCGGGGGGDTTYAITFCASTTSGKFSSSPNSQPPGTGSLQPHTDGTTAYTGGGSQVGGAATTPWRIVLVVGILGAVTAALGVLAKFLGLFKLCCNQPAAGAAG